MRLILLLMLTASPAAAYDACAEWWFTRNLILDRAGYCFESPLGQAIFDNAGCTPGDPRLDRDTLNQIAAIQALEQAQDCAINTGGTRLDVPYQDQRQLIVDIPIPSEYESGCIGWRGGPIPLHSARNEASAVTGRIEPGSDILFAFEEVDGWSFFTDMRGGPLMGWFRTPRLGEKDCAQFAG